MIADAKFFDHWAGDYDRRISRETKGYPFEGYYNVLASMLRMVGNPKDRRIMDIGIGTGLLTVELYKKGAHIFGIDFSEKMLAKAHQKMPDATLYHADFAEGFSERLKANNYDFIISSYAFHHVDDGRKVALITEMEKMLAGDGKILIADIGFRTRKDFLKCAGGAQKNWDDSEHYVIWEEFKLKMRGDISYQQVSSCAGILSVSR